jgi:Undecaprenyl-phosphate glucose phosphotransferase
MAGATVIEQDSALLSKTKLLPGYSARRLPAQKFLIEVWDGLCVFTTGVGCAVVYTHMKLGSPVLSGQNDEFISVAMRISVVGGLLAPLVLRAFPKSWRNEDWGAILGQLAVQLGVLVSIMLAIGFLTRALIYVPREWALGWLFMMFMSAIVGRVLIQHVAKKAMPLRLLRQKVVVAGTKAAADSVISLLCRSPDNDVEVVRTFYDDLSADGPRSYIVKLLQYAKQYPVDRVVLASPSVTDEQLDDVINQLKAINVDVAVCPHVVNPARHLLRIDDVGGLPMIVLTSRPICRRGLIIKSAVDKTIAFLILLWILPLLAIIAISIRLESPGPVLFRQRRHGLNNSEFDIIKFRTMIFTQPAEGEKFQQTQRNDARVTRVGRFLRRSSLDELPQLFNVLRGEMSLVGPRPHPTMMRTEGRLGSEIIAEYPHRHRVKPGMTGWAQIHGYRGATGTIEQLRHRVAYDMFYIENWSVWMDLKIIAMTPIKVLLNNDTAF